MPDMEKGKVECRIGDILKAKKMTLAFAESCTGGLLSHRITNIPGSSEYFKGAVVSYSNEIKRRILGVPDKMINACGAVSPEVVKRMASGVLIKYRVDIALSVSGIAGPGGGSGKKPVGLCYYAIATKKNIEVGKIMARGNRGRIKKAFSDAALLALERTIKEL